MPRLGEPGGRGQVINAPLTLVRIGLGVFVRDALVAHVELAVSRPPPCRHHEAVPRCSTGWATISATFRPGAEPISASMTATPESVRQPE